MSDDKDRNDDPQRPFGGYRPDGLYVFGPLGTHCAIIALITRSLLIVSGSSTQGMRRQRAVENARDILRRALNWRADGSDPEEQNADLYRAVLIVQAEKDDRERRVGSGRGMTRVGRFLVSAAKRPNSGRKRRAVA